MTVRVVHHWQITQVTEQHLPECGIQDTLQHPSSIPQGERIKGAYTSFFRGRENVGVLHHREISRAKAWEFIITIPGGSVIKRNWQEYDQAEWLLSMAVGKYAGLIGAERSMPAPDQGKIDDWLEKQAVAADLLDDLDLFGREKVSDLLSVLKEEC